jgi:hypothetical protein
MKSIADLVNVKTCVTLHFVYDFFFGCKAVKLEDYQLTAKRIDLFTGVPVDEI